MFEDRGRGSLRFQSQEFTKACEDAMGGMVERRMNASIITLGSFWYSAWVNAGLWISRPLRAAGCER